MRFALSQLNQSKNRSVGKANRDVEGSICPTTCSQYLFALPHQVKPTRLSFEVSRQANKSLVAMYGSRVLTKEADMFSDEENDVLFLSLKSLDWTTDKYINTSVLIDQINHDSILQRMPGAKSAISRLEEINDEEARKHFECLVAQRATRVDTIH